MGCSNKANSLNRLWEDNKLENFVLKSLHRIVFLEAFQSFYLHMAVRVNTQRMKQRGGRGWGTRSVISDLVDRWHWIRYNLLVPPCVSIALPLQCRLKLSLKNSRIFYLHFPVFSPTNFLWKASPHAFCEFRAASQNIIQVQNVTVRA
jgi:hypothetical protein